MNQELLQQLEDLDFGESVIVTVNPEIKDALNLINFQEETLRMELDAVRENRYGFYNREHVIDILAKIEDKRVEKVELFNAVGKALLGDDYRKILDHYGAEFQIDMALPVILFFKPSFLA